MKKLILLFIICLGFTLNSNAQRKINYIPNFIKGAVVDLETVSTATNLSSTHVGKYVRVTGTTTVTITEALDDNMLVGQTISILNANSTDVTITIGTENSNVTLNGSTGGSETITTAHTAGVLLKTGTDTYEFY